jgi:hypothetical protein
VFPNWKLEYGAFFHSESTFTAIYVDDSEQSMAKSTDDFGKNWSSMDMDAPGFSLATVPLLNGAFLSAAKPTDSTDLSDFHWYYGSSAKGPWVPLPDLQSINEIGNVVNGKLYASQPDGIYALTLPTVGLQARTSLASTLRASVQAGAIVVSGAQPGAWELLDAQGRRALAGTTREARFTIAAPGRGMWIVRVGQQRTVVMVP